MFGYLCGIHRIGEESELEPSWPLRLAEAYVRGDDLIASYHACDEWPYSPQLYWRVESSLSSTASVHSISILVSVQTDSLDTFPRIGVRSQVECDEIIHFVPARNKAVLFEVPPPHRIQPVADNCCLVRRLTGVPLSYVEIMPGSDFRALEVWSEGGGACCATWELFADHLEKGVIRRARMYSVFLPRENDLHLAAECCRAIDKRPLPLTA